MNKDLKLVLLALGLFAFGDGLFYNFQELWLIDNGLTVKTVSIVFSVCAIVCVSVIFLCSNIIKHNTLKKFLQYSLFAKFIIILSLFFLYKTNFNILIKFLTICDYSLDVEIFVTIYPIISHITKNDKIYAFRTLIYSGTYYSGMLVSSILLGKVLLFVNFDYNTYNLLAALFTFFAFLCVYKMEFVKYIKNDKNDEKKIMNKVIKKMKKDSISKSFLLYNFFEKLSYTSICGLMLTVLTQSAHIKPTIASNIIFILGLLGVLIASIVMKYLSFKDYRKNIATKYVSRLILCIIAIIANNIYYYLLTLVIYAITNVSYINSLEAPFINRYTVKEQFAFNTFVEMTTYLAGSLGIYICGYSVNNGLRIGFILSTVFLIIQLFVMLKTFELYNLEKRNKK